MWNLIESSASVSLAISELKECAGLERWQNDVQQNDFFQLSNEISIILRVIISASFFRM